MKETFYFPHDYNARSDEKILKLRRKYGWEGYGIYWCLVEMLVNSSEARLPLSDMEDYAFEMHSECERIEDVIFNFGLFKNDEKFFWSSRLVKFFKEREKKSEAARKSAKVRWNKEKKVYANAKRTQCDSNAIKERKGKEIKGKESREKFGEFQNVLLGEDEYKKLKDKFGEDSTKERIEKLSVYIASKGKRYTSHYATILSWAKKDGFTEKKEEVDIEARRREFDKQFNQ